jgi:hypothetical protein
MMLADVADCAAFQQAATAATPTDFRAWNNADGKKLRYEKIAGHGAVRPTSREQELWGKARI